MSKGRFIYVPLELAQTPANGECLVDHWWMVQPEKGISFWYMPFGYTRSEEPSPQCNSSEHVARHLAEQLNPDCDVVQLPVVFLRHAQRAMAQDKAKLSKEGSAS